MLKLRLNEDLFDDIVDIDVPDVEADITIDPELSGPETPEDIGQATILLDAISCIAKNIDQYNVLRANLTDPEMVAVVDEMASNENTNLGKLQTLLKKVSPNAENIMNGAVEAEQELSESLDKGDTVVIVTTTDRNGKERLVVCKDMETAKKLHPKFKQRNVYPIQSIDNKNESLDEGRKGYSKGFLRKYKGCSIHDEGYTFVVTNEHGKTIGQSLTEIGCEAIIDEYVKNNKSLDEDWRDDEVTNKDIEDWTWEIHNKVYQIERSIKIMLKKHPEYKDDILSTAKSCRNILKNLCSFYNESFNEDLADYIQHVHDKDEYLWNLHNTDYSWLYDMCSEYSDNWGSTDCEDTIQDCIRRMPRDKQEEILIRLVEPFHESLNEGNWEDPEWRKYHGVDDDSFYDDNIETFGSPYSEEEPDEEEVHLVLSKNDRFVGDVDDDFEARYDINSIKELEESAERNMIAQKEKDIMGAWQESLNPMANMKPSSVFVPPVVQPMYPTTPQSVNENQNITEDIMNVDFADIDDDF